MKIHKHNYLSLITMLALLGVGFIKCHKNTVIKSDFDKDEVIVRQWVINQNKKFETQIQNLISLMATDISSREMKQQFINLRQTYKKMEWAVEYFMPYDARFINGPAIPEYETAEQTVLEAEGLQVLEELIITPTESIQKKEIIRYLKKLLNQSYNIDTYFKSISINLPQLIDAVRLQVYRIITLGITGFDTPMVNTSLSEAKISLLGIRETLLLITDSGKNQEILLAIQNAIDHLPPDERKNTFDYLNYITRYLNKLSSEIYNYQKNNYIPNVVVTRAINQEVPTLFSPGAFNPDAFVPGELYKVTEAKITLGEKLFYDKILSGTETRSCATCHHADLAFTDGLTRSPSLSGGYLVRNTPSLNYANYQHGQFWDMRVEDLESQSKVVITNREEMNGDFNKIIHRIEKIPEYATAFKEIYKTDTIEVWQIQNVLASYIRYIRSLSVFKSPFDAYMRGDTTAMTTEQKHGFNLFVGKAKCATCHFIPLFNGTVPPVYTKTEQEILGTAENFHTRA